MWRGFRWATSKNPAHSEPTRGLNHRSCQYIRGQYKWLLRYRSGGAQIVCRGFARPAIGHNFERDLLSLVQAVHPGAFDGADVDEYILAAVIRLDETKAFLAVEPLYDSLRHKTLLSGTCLFGRAVAQPAHIDRDLEEGRQSDAKARRGQVGSAETRFAPHNACGCLPQGAMEPDYQADAELLPFRPIGGRKRVGGLST